MSNKLLRIILCMFSCFFIISSGAAFASVPTDVQKQIDVNFELHKPVLEGDKKNFGLTNEESFTNSKLGKGYPVYTLLPKESRIGDQIFTFNGYVFPIKVGQKSAGIVLANKVDGKWVIIGGASNLTFEEDIKEALKGDKDNDSVKIIRDQSVGLYAMSYQKPDGETIIPLRDNPHLNVKKDIAKKPKEIADSINNYEKENKNASPEIEGGGAGILGKNDGFNQPKSLLGVTVIGIFALSSLLFVILKRRKNYT